MRGITASRTMARTCGPNVMVIALARDYEPHVISLAHSVAMLCKEVEALFRGVLMVCKAQGMIGENMFAIDGCGLPSNTRR